MDLFVSSLKSKFKKNDDDGENLTDEEVAMKRQEDVRQTLSKVDPNTLVDVDDMVQLSEGADGEQASVDNSSLETPQGGNTLKRTFSVLKKSSKDDVEEKPEVMANPIEDDVFIYYD